MWWRLFWNVYNELYESTYGSYRIACLTEDGTILAYKREKSSIEKQLKRVCELALDKTNNEV